MPKYTLDQHGRIEEVPDYQQLMLDKLATIRGLRFIKFNMSEIERVLEKMENLHPELEKSIRRWDMEMLEAAIDVEHEVMFQYAMRVEQDKKYEDVKPFEGQDSVVE